MYKQMIGTPGNYSVLPLLLEIPKLNPNPKKVIHFFFNLYKIRCCIESAYC